MNTLIHLGKLSINENIESVQPDIPVGATNVATITYGLQLGCDVVDDLKELLPVRVTLTGSGC